VTVQDEPLLRARDLPPGAIVPVDVGGDEYVVWRARSGRVCAIARQCPHLDSDLADGRVDGDELVCAAHGWAFDTDGHAFKRNLAGRVDPKDDATTLPVVEVGGDIRVAR
jgi:phenylpropionate dioxygenase-like ring-hydroxylating dioxygenase large terminal subunit